MCTFSNFLLFFIENMLSIARWTKFGIYINKRIRSIRSRNEIQIWYFKWCYLFLVYFIILHDFIQPYDVKDWTADNNRVVDCYWIYSRDLLYYIRFSILYGASERASAKVIVTGTIVIYVTRSVIVSRLQPINHLLKAHIDWFNDDWRLMWYEIEHIKKLSAQK